jgi:toxin ETX/toxin MTX2
MKNLQSITDAWGKWKAKTHHNKCRFTASTNYKKEDRLDGYHEHEVKATAQPIVYDESSPPLESPSTVYELWFDNASDVDQTQVFSKDYSSTESFTWSMTEALSIGVEVSASAGVEGVATASATISTQLSLSSTQEKAVSETQSWSANSTIVVPARSSVKCDMILDVGSYERHFTSPVLLKGDVAIWYDEQVDDHFLWFVSIGHVFREVRDNDLADISGYEIHGSTVIANSRGQMRGKEGVRVSVAVTQYPLRTATAPDQFKAQKSYRVVL